MTKKFVSAISWCGTCGPKNWNHTGYATTGTNSASAQPRHASACRHRVATGRGDIAPGTRRHRDHHRLGGEQLLGDEELHDHQRAEQQPGAARVVSWRTRMVCSASTISGGTTAITMFE